MDTDTPQDQMFLEHIIKLIVTEPDQVEITRTIDDLGVLITLKVSKEDMGRVIGKDGQTAKAIRTLLRAIGSRNDTRVNMKILEPEGSEMGEAAPPAAEAPAEEAPAEETPAKCPNCGAEMTEGHVCPVAAEEAPAEEAPAEEAPAEEDPAEEEKDPVGEL